MTGEDHSFARNDPKWKTIFPPPWEPRKAISCWFNCGTQRQFWQAEGAPMNYDELAFLQRQQQQQQAAEQHRKSMQAMADLQEQMRINNLPPAYRAQAQRAFSDRQVHRATVEYEAGRFGLFFGLALCIALCGGLFVMQHFIELQKDSRERDYERKRQQAEQQEQLLARQQEEKARLAAEKLERERLDTAVANAQAVKDDLNRKMFPIRLKRATEGSAEFQYELALQYLNGQAVAKDLSAAKEWLRKAAGQGHKPAQRQLALLEPSGTPPP